MSVYTYIHHAFANSTWLSKRLKSGSSRPRANEIADRSKHAYPDIVHVWCTPPVCKRISETGEENGRRLALRHLQYIQQCITVGLLPLAKNAMHSPSWRAGASQLSRLNGRIFYIYLGQPYVHSNAHAPVTTCTCVYVCVYKSMSVYRS